MKSQPIVAFILVSFALLINFMNLTQASPHVLVEFLYYEPCQACPGFEIYYQVYVHNSILLNNIERDYGSAIQVQRIYWMSSEGREKINLYNLGFSDWNTIVVNGEFILKGGDQFVNETELRQVIDYCLILEHDIVVSEVTVNSRNVLKGDVLIINATVKNRGRHTESLNNITISFNSTVVEKIHVGLLEPGATVTVYVNVNTMVIDEGCYVLTVYAPPVEKEVNINNNLYNAGIVEIRTQNIGLTYVHDVGVLEIVPSKFWTTNEEKINVTVVVRNLGTIAENFTLRIFLNNSFIAEDYIHLHPNFNLSKLFIINLAGLPPGSYVIDAVAELEKDSNMGNNRCSSRIHVLNIVNEIDELFFVGNVLLAFTFGFFETFSPCLLVLLSFLVSYTLGETISFKEGFVKILMFGLGFLFTALSTSTIALFLFSIAPFQKIMTMLICILAILLGLNMIGINVARLPKKQQNTRTKVMIQKLTIRYARTYTGLFVVGFLFYFLDPCIAPFFFAIVPLMLNVNFAIIVLAFCLGVILPFLIIGVTVGSLSRLTRVSYKHKSKLRLISGLILICYSIYLILMITSPLLNVYFGVPTTLNSQ